MVSYFSTYDYGISGLIISIAWSIKLCRKLEIIEIEKIEKMKRQEQGYRRKVRTENG